jgi:WD40 repeat protein
MADDTPISGPYKGLIPYSEDDAPFFFGRKRERENIISNLMGSRLTLLYGPTGVGKSSVLNAGVAYRLHILAKENLNQNSKPEFAPVVFRKWQGEPLLHLHESIKKSVARVLGSEAGVGDLPSNDLSHTLERCSQLIGGDLLIILDQFEEYFLYHGGGGGDSGFAREFARAVNRRSLRASFLISIREDALAKLDFFKGKIPELFKNYLRIQHLTSAAAREAIRRPLKVYSEVTHADPEFTIEDQLVDEVCKQVGTGSVFIGETGYGAVGAKLDAAHVETSFLQLVMTRLWEYELDRGSHHLHSTSLQKLGGAANIVQTHLDVNLTGFPDEEQEAAAAIFRYLVTPSGSKVAYTPTDLADLTELPRAIIESVLEKLCAGDTRILRSFYTERHKQDEKNYEIFHDVLAPAILDWRTRYLSDKERARIEQEAKIRQEEERARLEEEARLKFIEEEKKIRRERVRARRKRTQFIVVLVLSALFSGVMYIFYYYSERQAERAIEAAREAQSQKSETLKMLEIVNTLDRSVPFFKAVMRGHSGPILTVDFSPDQKKIVTASLDNNARVWEADTGGLIRELKGHRGGVRSAVFSPDGRLIVTASDDNTARIWDAETGQSLHELKGHTNEVSAAQFSSDSKLIVTASDDGTARVWDSHTGEGVAELGGHLGAVTYASFSPDNSSVVTASTDGTARIWDVSRHTSVTLKEHHNVVNMAVFSPDGNLVVTASSDWDARIWRVSDGRSVNLKGHQGPLNSAKFSPDGSLIVTASDDKTARVWEVKSQRLLMELKGHAEEVLSAAFGSDSVRVITASADNTARVWEASSGRILFELRGHTSTVNDAIFSPNGELAATASQDNTARTWDIKGMGGIRITDVSVSAEPDNYYGPCPVRVRFSAIVTAIGNGTIKYRFVRNTGKAGPERSLAFESSGSKEINTTWKLGGKAFPTLSGTFHLEITSPQSLTSKEAVYNIRCQIPADSGDSTSPPATPSPTPVIP